MKLIDLTGQRFGRWAVVRQMPTINGRARWLCRCQCGTKRVQMTGNLRNGTTTSCGCIRREQCRRYQPEYRSWIAAKTRCSNPNQSNYKNYGARGITMCAGWASSFENFYHDLGPRPNGHTLERIDNVKGYWCGRCPECRSNNQTANCKWATRLEQNHNTRTNRQLSFQGQTAPLTVWARELGIPRNTIVRRLTNGWSIEAALSTPVLKRPWQTKAARSATRYKLCKDCGQPVLRKGQVRKHPEDYRHARGCPSALQIEREQTEAMWRQFAALEAQR